MQPVLLNNVRLNERREINIHEPQALYIRPIFVESQWTWPPRVEDVSLYTLEEQLYNCQVRWWRELEASASPLPIPRTRIFMLLLFLFLTIPVRHKKRYKGLNRLHHDTAMWNQGVSFALAHLRRSNWRDTHRLLWHEVLQLKHCGYKMRKLEKELVQGVV